MTRLYTPSWRVLITNAESVLQYEPSSEHRGTLIAVLRPAALEPCSPSEASKPKRCSLEAVKMDEDGCQGLHAHGARRRGRRFTGSPLAANPAADPRGSLGSCGFPGNDVWSQESRIPWAARCRETSSKRGVAQPLANSSHSFMPVLCREQHKMNR